MLASDVRIELSVPAKSLLGMQLPSTLYENHAKVTIFGQLQLSFYLLSRIKNMVYKLSNGILYSKQINKPYFTLFALKRAMRHKNMMYCY